MPVRNVNKPDIADAYYHVYFRGLNKQEIFRDEADYKVFVSFFDRYLTRAQRRSPFGVYPHLRGRVELLCYCLMPNHVHLLLYQIESAAMSQLMRGLLTSYSRYFNNKYRRSGPLFETRYKASYIDSETYLVHITRYIHMNPRYWKRYRYSSIQFYLGVTPAPEWLQYERLEEMTPAQYLSFCQSYQGNKDALRQLKDELAT